MSLTRMVNYKNMLTNNDKISYMNSYALYLLEHVM